MPLPSCGLLFVKPIRICICDWGSLGDQQGSLWGGGAGATKDHFVDILCVSDFTNPKSMKRIFESLSLKKSMELGAIDAQ